MKLGLGIDTGGTYTDGVIFDFNSNEIIKSGKSVTVKENLQLGIVNILDKMPQDILGEVMLVSLSTTLATNACVEGKGSRGTLVLIGCDKETVRKYGAEYGLPDVTEIIFIDGGHDQKGDVLKEPDWKVLEQRILEYQGKTDSFGIVQMWGMRNPEFEKKAKGFIKKWTGLPVVCGHELAGELNFLKRAATALLNAKLIPLINEFMDAVKISLKERGIHAPLVIVRGDGSIMSEEFVREKPIETLLSGPAASVIGGMNLNNEKNALVVDMGGTTSDLALVKEGRPMLAYDGADVGDWKTATKSIDIRTIGLGGDSHISFDGRDNLTIGPRRVAPLSWMVNKWPYLLDKIRAIHQEKRIHTRSLCQFFYLVRSLPEEGDFCDKEKHIVAVLEKGPLSIENLAEVLGTSIYEMNLERLEQLGIIMRGGLTPTDIMHLTGDFSGWNKDGALMGAEILAHRLGCTLDKLILDVNTNIKSRLYLNIVKLLMEREKPSMVGNGLTPQLEDMILMGYENPGENSYISWRISTDFSLIGIGAPIHVYLPDVAEALNTPCLIQEHAAVANAVGAITGNISVEEKVIVKPRYSVAGIEGYDCFAPDIKMHFEDYEEAIDWAKKEISRAVEELAIARGAEQVEVTLDTQENSTIINVLPGESEEEQETETERARNLLLETIIIGRAVGSLKWI